MNAALVFEEFRLVSSPPVRFLQHAAGSDSAVLDTAWFEGVMLVAVYVLLALAFFFATAS